MAEKRRRAIILRALTRMRRHRLEVIGGNPAWIDGDTIPGYVVIADINDQDEPTLDIYTWDYMERWYDAAKRYRATGGKLSLVYAMYEVEGDLDSPDTTM